MLRGSGAERQQKERRRGTKFKKEWMQSSMDDPIEINRIQQPKLLLFLMLPMLLAGTNYYEW